MITQSLIAFDTDHIKGYVFGTSKLKEIRGASSMLDYLNRVETVRVAEAKEFGATKIYANGGSALFLVDTDKAEQLGRRIQKLYREKTSGRASITCAIQPIPDDKMQSNIMQANLQTELELLGWRLRLAKSSPPEDTFIAQPSHALLSLCTACGTAYAEEVEEAGDDDDEGDEEQGYYCKACMGKRTEDRAVRENMRKGPLSKNSLWGRIRNSLETQGYNLSDKPERPKDFNVFREFTRGKDYLGLIYADANSMGKILTTLHTLEERQKFANTVDNAIFEAMGYAIKRHLPVQKKLFPFDILLIGGDDIVMVTPAAKALHVAQSIAEKFYEVTGQKYTLSIGVVLAPIKHPFNLQRILAEETLKAAKKAGAKDGQDEHMREQAYINFVVVTGSTSLDYHHIYQQLHREQTNYSRDEFYATLRPYTPTQLQALLKHIEMGNARHLGRTKLHQLRECDFTLMLAVPVKHILALLHAPKPIEDNQANDAVKHLLAAIRHCVAYRGSASKVCGLRAFLLTFSRFPCQNMLHSANICFTGGEP